LSCCSYFLDAPQNNNSVLPRGEFSFYKKTDATLGDKRLASMPDRTTNTILTLDGPVYRPTVINCYGGNLGTTAAWWAQWRTFIFSSSVRVPGKDGQPEDKQVSSLLIPIKRAKYPALSEAEEKISIPLQALAGAIFDAILVHMMNSLALSRWQGLRSEVCEALNLKKTEHTLGIIAATYGRSDVVFLQVSAGWGGGVCSCLISAVLERIGHRMPTPYVLVSAVLERIGHRMPTPYVLATSLVPL
jgi:hypothetical protein